jgi:hypothetical protein
MIINFLAWEDNKDTNYEIIDFHFESNVVSFMFQGSGKYRLDGINGSFLGGADLKETMEL